jgi:ferritin
MNSRVQEALNKQINFEIESARLYLSMALWFHSVNLPGFAHWMEIQYKEETLHAEKMLNFMLDRRGTPVLEALPKPPVSWASPLAAFEEAFAHEQQVSDRINNLVSLALEVKDHASNNFLQWFVSEQVEEEANADKVIQQLRLNANQPAGIFMLDRELAQRVLTPPPTA